MVLLAFQEVALQCSLLLYQMLQYSLLETMSTQQPPRFHSPGVMAIRMEAHQLLTTEFHMTKDLITGLLFKQV